MKDVESGDSGQQYFCAYERAIAELKSIKERLYDHLQELTAVEQEAAKSRRHTVKWAVIGIGIGILVAFIFWLIQK